MTHPSVIARAALADDPVALREAMASDLPYGMPRREAWRAVLAEVAVSLGHSDPQASVDRVMDKWGRTVVGRESLQEIIAEMRGYGADAV